MAFARGRCWDIIAWVFFNYEVFDKESGKVIDGYTDVAMRYMAHLAWAIEEFKKKATENMGVHGSQIPPEEVSKQIRLCLISYLEIPRPAPANPDSTEISLSYPFPEKYGVRMMASPVDHNGKQLSYALNPPC